MSEEKQEVKEEKEEQLVRDYFSVGEMFTYFFRKKDPNRKSNINLRMMHGVNKFSIVAFIIGVTFFIIKRVFFT